MLEENHILFLEPVFKERIWGGRALQTQFSYELPAGVIGECWGISAHPNGESIIKYGIHQGRKLSELWSEERELFGNAKEEKFPLLVKILDANSDLSVQVHPFDDYAKKFENGELGKTECWYVLDCEPDASIVFGHHATSRDEAQKLINEGNWQKLLRYEQIKPSDFFYVPSGTVHALCKGTLILEVQQSSDTTYRIYDYNRIDEFGNLRELHINKALDVITIPHQTTANNFEIINTETTSITKFVNNEFFCVSKYIIDGTHNLKTNQTYSLISIIEGQGEVDGSKVKKGDHFIILANCEKVQFSGTLQLIATQPTT